LIASSFVPRHTYRKFFLIFFPSSQYLILATLVFILSTWLNTMYKYPRVYYNHVDNTTNPRQERGN
jgi:hypothetical protein